MSSLFVRTLRDDPADAEVDSHRLLVRAGYIRRIAAGLYSWLPLGSRVLRSVEQIVREEMDRAGAQETVLPILQPRELWQRSGRDADYGPLMFRLLDRKETGFCLSPTAEEVITTIVAQEYTSYRDLPVNLYQINWKYRDELRPRFGLLRSREFLMKDAYSFDADIDGLRASYAQMYDAYHRVFERCGLTFRPVEAQSGEIGGDVNHEFMAVAAVGEDDFVWCRSCDYAANVEAARRGTAARHRPTPPRPRASTHRRWRPCTPPTCPVSRRSPRTWASTPRSDAEVHRLRRRRRARARARARRPRGQRVRARRQLRAEVVRLYDDDDFAAHPEVAEGIHRAASPRRDDRRRRSVGRARRSRGSPARTRSTTTCATPCSEATSRSTSGPTW